MPDKIYPKLFQMQKYTPNYFRCIAKLTREKGKPQEPGSEKEVQTPAETHEQTQ